MNIDTFALMVKVVVNFLCHKLKRIWRTSYCWKEERRCAYLMLVSNLKNNAHCYC